GQDQLLGQLAPQRRTHRGARVSRAEAGEDETYVHGGVGEETLQLLWEPYLMSYMAEPRTATAEGMTSELFLDIPRMSDADGLMVARGEHVYVVLNLYPYNPGHSMVVPYRKVADLEDLSDDESRELMSYTQHL